MRFQDNSKPKNKIKILILFLLIIGISFFLFTSLQVKKFNFSGDTQYVDERLLKIISLTYLKDNPMIWINKSSFENELKIQQPQVKSVSFSIINSDTLGVSISAEDICCLISDFTDKKYVLSSEGVILREYELNNNSNFNVISVNNLKINDKIEKNLVSIIKKFTNEEFKIENIEEKSIFIESNYLYLNTKDGKKLLLGENTDLRNINENYKSIKSHLEQNGKIYSILDFRFEKIIVK